MSRTDRDSGARPGRRLAGVARVVPAGSALVAASAVLALTGCGSSDAGASSATSPSRSSHKLSVVVSTNVYGDIVQQVAGTSGSAVTVTSIISDPDQDPHSYEADAGTQLALSKADLVIENGGGYDDFIDSMLKGSGRTDTKVINVVDLSGKQAPAGGELNEHVWYDFPTVQKLSSAIATALSAADPGGAATFSVNAKAFNAKVDALTAQEGDIKSAHQGDGAAITEPVPLYLLQAAGLVDKTPEEFSEAIEEGSDVPASVLDQTLDLFRRHTVKVLAYNEQTSGPETEKVLAQAKADKVPVVPVTETLPQGKDYLGWMSSNLQALSAALS